MPDIRFTFLVCSYLPGLPLATILYWLFLGGSYGNGQNGSFFVLYFLVVPLVIGLFIDGLRHVLEVLLRSKLLFWVDLSFDDIPRIVENKGRESLARYERIEEKLYFMYEHSCNTWISSVFTLAIILRYYHIIDKNIFDNPRMTFFVIIMDCVLLLYIGLAFNFRVMHRRLVKEVTKPMPESSLASEDTTPIQESQLESESEQ